MNDGGKSKEELLTELATRKMAEAQRHRLEAQLRQSQKMEAVGTLAGGIAHDFNNVLGAIFIHTEVAQTLIQPSSAAQDNLANVLVASGRAKDLVQQILTFSRQVETQRQPVRLTSVIQDALTLLRASLPATIEIRQSLLDEGDTIFADPTQLHQIVLNICVNAEHAMRDTGGIMEVRVDPVEINDTLAHSHPDLQPGSHVRLTIRDSGHGMTPEVIARIFDPFYTTKGVGDGTGMGLALVHGIVASHGGAITVASMPGAGTTFTLYFPCTQEPVGESPQTRGAIPSGAGCIMIVDDEPMLASGMKALLMQFGYEVVEARNGGEGLRQYRVEPADLIITDILMPEQAGVETIRELKRDFPDVKIIAISGGLQAGNMDVLDIARRLGARRTLRKPFSRDELMITIREVLQG